MAAPKFTSFKAKAKQSEAKVTINYIKTLAESRFIDQGTYDIGLGGFGRLTRDTDTGNCGSPDYCIQANSLGFGINCANRHYDYQYQTINGYTITATEISSTPLNCAESRTIFPGCTTPFFDQWQSNKNTSEISHTSDPAPSCL